MNMDIAFLSLECVGKQDLGIVVLLRAGGVE
jgi:hypothetical protein